MLVSLGEVATLREAPAIHAALLEGLETHSEVEIDASALRYADLSLIQLLEAARVQAAQTQKSLRLTTPANEALSAFLRRCGSLTAPSSADTAFWFQGEAPQ